MVVGWLFEKHRIVSKLDRVIVPSVPPEGVGPAELQEALVAPYVGGYYKKKGKAAR